MKRRQRERGGETELKKRNLIMNKDKVEKKVAAVVATRREKKVWILKMEWKKRGVNTTFLVCCIR